MPYSVLQVCWRALAVAVCWFSEGDLSRYTLIPWALMYSQSAWFAIGRMVLHMVINLDISTGG